MARHPRHRSAHVAGVGGRPVGSAGVTRLGRRVLVTWFVLMAAPLTVGAVVAVLPGGPVAARGWLGLTFDPPSADARRPADRR